MKKEIELTYKFTEILKALREDLNRLFEQNNDIVLGLTFLYQIIEKANQEKDLRITIPEHIKKHFRIE